MNVQTQKTDDLTIEWAKAKEDNFIVKFNKMKIPIEMNAPYYTNVLKQLQN